MALSHLNDNDEDHYPSINEVAKLYTAKKVIESFENDYIDVYKNKQDRPTEMGLKAYLSENENYCVLYL